MMDHVTGGKAIALLEEYARFADDNAASCPVKSDVLTWQAHARNARQAIAQFRALAQQTREPGFVKPDNDKQVFFYEQDFYVLSNFSAFTLQWEGIRFYTSEAAYQWTKFAPFSEADTPRAHICDLIQSAPSAHEAFKIAEHNKALRRADWDEIKIVVMRDILRAKAEQHEYVRRKLLATGNRELIEDSWRDDFWGWGPNRDAQNMLGKLWMEVREELRASALPSTDRSTPEQT